MSTIKKIIYTVFCMGVLYSCSKDDMEVQKNTDLSWEVDKDLVSNDIRTAIGYDPRYNYIGFESSEEVFPVWTFGKLVLTTEKAIRHLKVSLDKPAEKDIKLSLEYDSDLYNELRNKYGGYLLGDKELVKILEKEKTILEGETSVTFELEGDFSEPKKVILPFSFKMEGDNSIRKIKGSDVTVIKVDIKSALDQRYSFVPSESSNKVLEAFNEADQATYNKWQEKLDDKIYIGNNGSRLGKGLVLISRLGRQVYNVAYNFDIEELENGNIAFTNASEGFNWRYYPFLSPISDIIVNNAPYSLEKTTDNKIKFISTRDSEVWFIIGK